MNTNVYQTVQEMLSQRGYLIDEEDDKVILAHKQDHKLCVFFNSSSKLNCDKIEEYIQILKQAEIDHSIIVYKESVTSMAKKIIDQMNDFTMELFHEKDMMFNITKHRLVPEHVSLTEKDTQEFKQQFGTQIPVLLRTDPVCRFYNFQKGDIIKVTRQGSYVSYRIVK